MKFGKQLELIKVVEKLGNGKEFRSDTDFGIKELISQLLLFATEIAKYYTIEL